MVGDLIHAGTAPLTHYASQGVRLAIEPETQSDLVGGVVQDQRGRQLMH